VCAASFAAWSAFSFLLLWSYLVGDKVCENVLRRLVKRGDVVSYKVGMSASSKVLHGDVGYQSD
jgi:hypothetical protein